jgi:hypothetical protein
VSRRRGWRSRRATRENGRSDGAIAPASASRTDAWVRSLRFSLCLLYARIEAEFLVSAHPCRPPRQPHVVPRSTLGTTPGAPEPIGVHRRRKDDGDASHRNARAADPPAPGSRPVRGRSSRRAQLRREQGVCRRWPAVSARACASSGSRSARLRETSRRGSRARSTPTPTPARSVRDRKAAGREGGGASVILPHLNRPRGGPDSRQGADPRPAVPRRDPEQGEGPHTGPGGTRASVMSEYQQGSAARAFQERPGRPPCGGARAGSTTKE